MQIYDIVLIGMALAIDACCLTIANCTTYKNTLTRKKEWSMPICFAIFQGIMPLIGYFIGSLFADKVKNISGYLTAGIFFVLFAKIIFDNIKEIVESKKQNVKNETEKQPKKANFTFGLLIIQGIATSIDALFVGVTLKLELSPQTLHIAWAVLMIAGITFVLVSIALLFGKTLGKIFGKYASWVGAVILLALAIKTLVEAIVG